MSIFAASKSFYTKVVSGTLEYTDANWDVTQVGERRYFAEAVLWTNWRLRHVECFHRSTAVVHRFSIPFQVSVYVFTNVYNSKFTHVTSLSVLHMFTLSKALSSFHGECLQSDSGSIEAP